MEDRVGDSWILKGFYLTKLKKSKDEQSSFCGNENEDENKECSGRGCNRSI